MLGSPEILAKVNKLYIEISSLPTPLLLSLTLPSLALIRFIQPVDEQNSYFHDQKFPSKFINSSLVLSFYSQRTHGIRI